MNEGSPISGDNIVSGVVSGALTTATSTVKNTVERLDPTRWQGYSHDQLYQMLQDGPGATASALPAQRWTEVASTLADVKADLRGALNRSLDSWQGDAANQAYQRLGTLATWADAASDNATTMGAATQRQAENIAKARADMPAPASVPPVSPDGSATPAVQVLTLQGDGEGPDAAQAAGEQAAHDVMAAYQQSTESTVEALGTFTAPKHLTRQQGPANGHGNVHGVSGVTTASGLVDGLLGLTGLKEHVDNGHHGSGGGTSSSGAHGLDPKPGPRYNAPKPTRGGRPSYGYNPILGFGGDRERNRRSGGGRHTSMPGANARAETVDLGTGPGPGGAPSGPPPNSTSGGLSGHISGVLASPGSASPAPPGAHGGTKAATGTGGQTMFTNPNDVPPPATANGTMAAGAGPGATSGAAAMGSGAEKPMVRRGFDPGLGAAGSWLAEPDPPTPSPQPVRRRDFKAQVRVTERVSVNGELVELPEPVIGDDQRNR